MCMQVLLAFSGGMNSRVLLGLAEEVSVGLKTVETLTVISCVLALFFLIQGLRLSAYKKLRFEPTVVVIDGQY